MVTVNTIVVLQTIGGAFIMGCAFNRHITVRASTRKVSRHRKKDLMDLNTLGAVQVKIVVKLRGQHIAYRDYTGAQTKDGVLDQVNLQGWSCHFEVDGKVELLDSLARQYEFLDPTIN